MITRNLLEVDSPYPICKENARTFVVGFCSELLNNFSIILGHKSDIEGYRMFQEGLRGFDEIVEVEEKREGARLEDEG